MPKPYSGDLRARVIEEIATGASRREAAERYGISPSVVVIWAQRFEKTGSVAAKPSVPPDPTSSQVLTLIAQQPRDAFEERPPQVGVERLRESVERVELRSGQPAPAGLLELNARAGLPRRRL